MAPRSLRPLVLPFALAACAESPTASAPDSAAAPAPSPAAASAAATVSAPAAATASAAAPVTAPAKGQVYVVAAVGDSLTDARSNGGKFLDELKKRCPESRFDNHGKGGDMVNQMRRRFERDVLGASDKLAYTHLIVFGGVNDLYSDQTAFRTPAKIEADLSAMYAAGRERGMKVVALTVAPWGGFSKWYNPSRARATGELNDWIRGRKGAGQVEHVIDAFALLSCGEPEKLCPAYMEPFKDGLHFGQKGHDKLAEALSRDVFSDCR
jgi:lysophospholipase L1-like esterase